MTMAPNPVTELQNFRLKYLSQFSSAVLIGGLDYECSDAFNYEKNTSTLPYEYGLPTEREINRWCEQQAEHPSFRLSNATLLPQHTPELF